MSKKLFRITYIIPLSFIGTLLASAYSYIWFDVELLSTPKVFLTIVMVILTLFLLANEGRD